MVNKKDRQENDTVVCEFFGIEITTKNPNVARILTTDVRELASLEIEIIPRSKRLQSEDEDLMPPMADEEI